MTTHALYRFFDAGGDLLYVGITNDPSRRWGRHANDKPWWNEVDHIEIERHPDREAVLIAERDAIKAEHPRYNVVHAPRPAAPPVALMQGEAAPPARTCESCDEPAKILYVLYRELAEYDLAYAAWDARVGAASPQGMRIISGTLLFEAPEQVQWHAVCLDHVPETGGPYGVPYPTTWKLWLHHTAHLMSKNWLGNTNWDDWLSATVADIEVRTWTTPEGCSHEVVPG